MAGMTRMTFTGSLSATLYGPRRGRRCGVANSVMEDISSSLTCRARPPTGGDWAIWAASRRGLVCPRAGASRPIFRRERCRTRATARPSGRSDRRSRGRRCASGGERLESDLAGLLDQFLRDLASTAGEQTRRARIVSLADAVEAVVEAGDFRRVPPDLCISARKYRLYGGVVPYHSSHVSSLRSQVGDAPTRAEWRAAPSGGPPLRSHQPVRPRDPVVSSGVGGPRSRSRQSDWEAPREFCQIVVPSFGCCCTTPLSSAQRYRARYASSVRMSSWAPLISGLIQAGAPQRASAISTNSRSALARQEFSRLAETRFAPLIRAPDRSARWKRASCDITPIRVALCG